MHELRANLSAWAELSTAVSAITHLPWLYCSWKGKEIGSPTEKYSLFPSTLIFSSASLVSGTSCSLLGPRISESISGNTAAEMCPPPGLLDLILPLEWY